MEAENEVYHGLVGRRLGRFWIGQRFADDAEGMPHRVEFNYRFIYDREIAHKDVIGFYHTHPNMTSSPSSEDRRTMDGWTVCFGKPLACLIKGTDGLKAHWFLDDEHEHITARVWRWKDRFFGIVPKNFQKRNEQC